MLLDDDNDDNDDENDNDGEGTYMSEHLILILQSGESLFKLRILPLQVFDPHL